MKNFDWTQFKRSIGVETDMQTMYNAWAKTGEIERWFLSKAEVTDASETNRASTDSFQTGDSYRWNWYNWDETELGKITQANGKDLIQFTFAGDCKVEITLKPYDKGTIVSLSQTNIPTDDKSKQDVRLGCLSGWSFYLVNLKSVYEGGLDLRNKDAALKIMLNN